MNTYLLNTIGTGFGWTFRQPIPSRNAYTSLPRGCRSVLRARLWNTNLAFTAVTIVPTVTFSLMWMGPYTLMSHRGGLLFLSTTSNSTSTSAYEGGSPLSEALTRSRYFSRYIKHVSSGDGQKHKQKQHKNNKKTKLNILLSRKTKRWITTKQFIATYLQ